MHQRHRSTGALGHALRKASQVFSRSEPAEPMASDAAAANPVRHRAHSQSWTESLPKAKACDDWQVSPPPSSYSGPSHDTWSAVERSPSERSSYDGFDLTIAARQKVSLRSRLPDQGAAHVGLSTNASARLPTNRYPFSAALLPDGIVPSVADFGLSLSVPSDLLERPSSPRQPGGTDSTGVTKSSTSSSLASDASSGSSIGSELGTPSLPSSPLFIDSVNFQNTDDDPAVKLDVAPAGRKPPASHFPGWAGYTVGSPDARLLKPCLVERGSYRISRTRASTDSDVCNLEFAACSWPLPPPRETWYEVEAGTGRRVLLSALIDLQTGYVLPTKTKTTFSGPPIIDASSVDQQRARRLTRPYAIGRLGICLVLSSLHILALSLCFASLLDDSKCGMLSPLTPALSTAIQCACADGGGGGGEPSHIQTREHPHSQGSMKGQKQKHTIQRQSRRETAERALERPMP
jgi:hypothetical protein